MHIALVEPEIPQNTGSVARLCAATNTRLHLVGDLGFSLEDRYLKRAGLDYWPFVDLRRSETWEEFDAATTGQRRLGFSARAETSYTSIEFRDDDILVFGCESRGLPDHVRHAIAPLYRIPLLSDGVRSLNLANAASIVLYEGLRQLGRV